MASVSTRVPAKTYAAHTDTVAEVAAKLPGILNAHADFTWPGKGSKKVPRPTEGDLLDLLIASKVLSARTRSVLRRGKVELKKVKAAEVAMSAGERAQFEATSAILWAARTEAELAHGLSLIEALFPGTPAAQAVPHLRAMHRSGAGVIYPTEAQVLSSRRALPRAIARENGGAAAVDFGALVGGWYGGTKDPRALAVAAAAASAASLAEGVWDWIFGDDDVPLFPQGTGPYNPCPTPNP